MEFVIGDGNAGEHIPNRVFTAQIYRIENGIYHPIVGLIAAID